MTPKEKAESLLELMSNQTYEYQPYAGATCLEAEVGYEAGKKCALIAVDEILEQCVQLKVGYWEQVREEIENL
jgi:hypothetical protein